MRAACRAGMAAASEVTAITTGTTNQYTPAVSRDSIGTMPTRADAVTALRASPSGIPSHTGTMHWRSTIRTIGAGAAGDRENGDRGQRRVADEHARAMPDVVPDALDVQEQVPAAATDQ